MKRDYFVELILFIIISRLYFHSFLYRLFYFELLWIGARLGCCLRKSPALRQMSHQMKYVIRIMTYRLQCATKFIVVVKNLPELMCFLCSAIFFDIHVKHVIKYDIFTELIKHAYPGRCEIMVVNCAADPSTCFFNLMKYFIRSKFFQSEFTVPYSLKFLS